MKTNFIFFICILLLSYNSSATEKVTNQKLKPHIVDHKYAGCPTNAYCTKLGGIKRNKWIEYLKAINKLNRRKIKNKIKKFKKKNGLPIEVWVYPGAKKNKNLIYWDSPCKHHNLPNHTLYIGEVFIKDLNKIIDKQVYIERSYLLKRNKKVAVYKTIRGQVPSKISKGNLVFTRDTEGFYYGLQISSKGKLIVSSIPSSNPAHSPTSVKCPEKLTNAVDKQKRVHSIYQGYFCKNIWNADLKIFQPMLFTWACN